MHGNFMDRDDRPALSLAHADFPLLRPGETIREALNKFRKSGIRHKIIYLYVADPDGVLLGVLPTRLLLTADLDATVGQLYVGKAIALNEDSTVSDAREAFARHKFLAFPIVDKQRKVLGVIDIEPFTGTLGDLHERTGYEDIFALLGMGTVPGGRITAISSFQMRFPWLLATIAAGTGAALLTSQFEQTLENALVLAFFLTLVLGLNESVCMQSATLTVQRLHSARPSLRDTASALRAELLAATLISGGCGAVVAVIVAAWRKDLPSAAAIGLSLFVSLVASSLWGVIVPSVMRRFLRDPKVAAAPIALGMADLSTLLIYFSAARLLLE